MARIDLRSLIQRLNPTTRRALEAAAGFCLSRTHYNVELEHWLLKLLDQQGTDLDAVLERFEIDRGRLATELERALERFKTGNGRPPALAPAVVDAAREAWLVASLEFEEAQASSGHLLLAMLETDGLARQALDSAPVLGKLDPAALRQEFRDLRREAATATATAGGAGGEGSGRAAAGGRTPNLDQFTIDLTARAATGAIDPVLGRDAEIRQVIDILTRRRQNNPILTGEPGVGKTAVAEGFALRVAGGDVPPSLAGVAVRTLDLSLLQAGAGVKGEFENRLKGVIEEVKASPQPIVLFIDEAHTLIGAGGAAGQGDAANLLKPALARGELRTIAATTWAEYKKYFERDAALARRFQVVKIEEPSEQVATEILRGLTATLERHHHVRVLDEGLVEAVRLSSRYLSGRQLPDKAVSVLDTACARVGLSQSATPAELEDCERRLARIATERRILERENATAGTSAERMAELDGARSEAEAERDALLERWQREKELFKEIDELCSALEAPFQPAPKGESAPPPLPEAEAGPLRARLEECTAQLRALQGERPLVHPSVDAQAVAEVISNWTGIPVGRMVSDQIQAVMNLEERLRARIVGQDHALSALAERIRTSRANLTDPRRPIGVFLLVGTSGVGKTETALALAELLYGGEQNMTVINMTEFKEEHKVSLLMGSPPGYVGYGEGGILTEAVRRKPYSVVLLDELEKAHPGVQDIFYQVFDKGILRDGEGRDIDFRNTVILATTNAGTDTIMSLCADPETMPNAAGLAEALRPELLRSFKPAFLGRVTLLPYFPLSDEVLRGIAELKLGLIRRRVAEHHAAELQWSEGLVEAVVGRCREVESGARNLDHILSGTLLPELATRFLERMARGEATQRVDLDVDGSGAFTYRIEG